MNDSYNRAAMNSGGPQGHQPFPYSCLMSVEHTPVTSYSAAHSYYIPVTQHARDTVEVITSNGHGSMIDCNTVYSEATGDLGSTDGESAGEHMIGQEELIDMAVHKLFNGELEKVDCVDDNETLPSINSLLLTEAAM